MKTTSCYTRDDIPGLLEVLEWLDKALDAKFQSYKDDPGRFFGMYLCPLLAVCWHPATRKLRPLISCILEDHLCLELWQVHNGHPAGKTPEDDYHARKAWIAKMQNDLKSYTAQ